MPTRYKNLTLFREHVLCTKTARKILHTLPPLPVITWASVWGL